MTSVNMFKRQLLQKEMYGRWKCTLVDQLDDLKLEVSVRSDPAVEHQSGTELWPQWGFGSWAPHILILYPITLRTFSHISKNTSLLNQGFKAE